MNHPWTYSVYTVVVCLAAHAVCFGQSKEKPPNIISVKGCPLSANFETENYIVRSSRVDDPFAFLRLIKSKEHDVSGKISSLVDGKPFRYRVMIGEALQLIEDEKFLPDTTDARVRILLEFITVENCSGLQLDLVYHVYSTQIPQVLSGTPESRATEKKAPQETTGLNKGGNPVQLVPQGGYDASERAFGGGRVETHLKGADWLPFHSLAIEGRGSSTMRFASAGLKGNRDFQGWLSHLEWILNYTNSSSPTGAGNFNRGTFSGQLVGVTKAFANGNLAGRFGAAMEGGNLQSTLQNANVSPNTVSSTGYSSSKVYAGISSRISHNVFAFSYGLQLGSVGSGIGWRKHIGDVQHEFWHPEGDHRILELESHFTVGALQVPGSVPVSERFFGGGRENLFLPNDSWKIRANPVIRAIPANRFYNTVDGAGAESFVSYNLTAAWAIWRTPLFPSALSSDTQFTSLLNGQMTSATSIEQDYYATKDPHYATLLGHLPGVQKDLATLKIAVQSAQAASGQLAAEFKGCNRAIGLANASAKAALSSKSVQQYGDVSALLPVDAKEDRLQGVLRACGDLNRELKSPEVGGPLASIDSEFRQMQEDFQQIDQGLAKRKATQDMAFVHRTIDTLIKEVNIYSISPVIVFDVAHISPATGGLGGTRYGPGGGIRLSLVSTVNFTAGYAWNPQHRSGEGPGATFFSLEVRDLFR